MNDRSQEIATQSTKVYYKRKKLTTTQLITYRATLVAMALAFKLLGNTFNFGSFKLTIVYIPWMLSGIVMGPIGGAIVAFSTDLVGQLIISTGGFPLPLTSVSNTLFGFLTGLVFLIPKLDNRIKLLISTVVVLCVCTLGIGTYALADLHETPYLVELVLRWPQALMVCVNAAAVGCLFPLLGKMGLVGGVRVPKKKLQIVQEGLHK